MHVAIEVTHHGHAYAKPTPHLIPDRNRPKRVCECCPNCQFRPSTTIHWIHSRFHPASWPDQQRPHPSEPRRFQHKAIDWIQRHAGVSHRRIGHTRNPAQHRGLSARTTVRASSRYRDSRFGNSLAPAARQGLASQGLAPTPRQHLRKDIRIHISSTQRHPDPLPAHSLSLLEQCRQ